MVSIYDVERHHHATSDVSALPTGLPVPDISLRARCTAGGSRNCTNSPETAEFHEVIERKKRKKNCTFLRAFIRC